MDRLKEGCFEKDLSWLGVVWLHEDCLRNLVVDFVKLDLFCEIRIVDLNELLLCHLDSFDECKFMITADKNLC